MPYVDVKSIVDQWKVSLKSAVRPGMALNVFQVGNDPASNAYIAGKKRDCEELGILFNHFHYDERTMENIGFDVFNRSQINPTIVQLPLPPGMEEQVCSMLHLKNDVDGMLPGSPYLPCTPKGILYLLDNLGIQLDGARACIIGRSHIVGRPMARLLTDRNATVTLCHTHTLDVPFIARQCGILIAAAGVKHLVDSSYVSDRTRIIVDVGINREGKRLYGDVKGDEVLSKYPDVLVTPVPGGVGLLTRAALRSNVVRRYC